MKSVIHWAIKNSPAMNTVLIASLLVGAVSLVVMRREVFPEFELEILLVTVPYPGASPDETEDAICEKIEAAISNVDGIKEYTSVAREGFGFVIIELKANVQDVQKVLNDVRSQIDQIPSFPDSVEDPNVRQIVFRIPAINLGLIGPETSGLDPLEQERQLRELAEDIREDLLELEPAEPSNPIRIPFMSLIAPAGRNAISSAEIVAARDYQIDVEIPEETLRDYGLSLNQVANIIRLHNIDLPGGKLETASQELLLRGKAKRELGEEIAEIPIITRTSGSAVTVGDLGFVRDGFADTTSHHRVDGRPAMVIGVSRTTDEDLFVVVDTVKKYVAEKRMPPGYEIKLWQDISYDVRDRIDLLTSNGLQGLLLVFLVLAIFLDLRLAFWVALGIPVSILGAGFVLLITGQSLNMLSMFAFLMALGIVVDDAIVIGENIYQKRQIGMGPVRAAVEGTYEVLPAVCASVTTTIIAFSPLLFVSGVMGKFIAVMPVAVIAMLVISLIESMLILPCHLSHENNLFLKTLSAVLYIFKPMLIPFHWLNRNAGKLMQWGVEHYYLPFLHWSLHHKSIVLSSAVGIIMLSIGFVISGIVPFEAFPKIDSRNISATVVFPDGTAAHEAKQATVAVEQALYQVDDEIQKEYGNSVLRVVYRRVGEVGDGLRGPTGVTNGSHVGTVEVELVTTAHRPLTSQAIVERWRKAIPKIPGTDVIKFGSSSMGPGGNKIELKLLALADSVEFLEQAAEECKDYLQTKKGVTDIEDDMRLGKYELLINLNEQGKSLNLDESAIARTVRAAYFGEEVMRLQRGRHEVKLMVRFPEEDRKSMEGFEEIRVRGEGGVERPLTEVAQINFQRTTSEINRLNGKRAITITADVDKSEDANAFTIIQEMQSSFMPQLLQRYKEDHGATLYVSWEGEQQQTNESFGSMFVGFTIAMLCMYLLLTLQFRSYLQPAIILAIIPFGCIGAILGHAVMGLDLTLFSFFGLIALTGVVVNDSIVLVDFINRRVRQGMSLTDSLIDAGRRRFRPVMLTSITTIAGLFPILMERSFQAQVLIPMAASLVFGLMAGTTLILILVPVFYQIYGICANVDHDRDLDDYETAIKSREPLEPGRTETYDVAPAQVTRDVGEIGPALG